MNESRDDEVKVIRAEYENTNFLINRSQSTSSIYASELRTIDSGYRYVKNVIEVDGGFYLLVNLEKYLSETFRVSSKGSAQLAVISDLSLFSKETVEFLKNDFISDFTSPEKGNVTGENGRSDESPAPGGLQSGSTGKSLVSNVEPDDNRIAFLIASNASVKAMSICRFNAHPTHLQDHLMERGVMATGFDENGIIFLIDLEDMLNSKQLLAADNERLTGNNVQLQEEER